MVSLKSERTGVKPINYIKRKTSTIPFGYELSEIDGYLKPVPNELKILYVAQELINSGTSLDKAVSFIIKNTRRKISKAALWKKFKKNNLVPNLYNINIEKLKQHCKVCNQIFYHSPIGTKTGGTGKQKYCSEECKRTNIARKSRIKYLVKMINKKPKKGFIYCITNPSFKGWVKIGKAIDTEKRLSGFNGSTPFRNFKLEYQKEFKNYSRAEYFLLCKFNQLSEQQSGEWFKINLEKAITVIKNYKDKNITLENVTEHDSPQSNLISNLQRVTYY